MTKPHKHAAVIKAWADGKQIQSASPVSPTADDPMGQREPSWFDVRDPKFDDRMLYRVKPASTRVRLRTAAMTNGSPAARAAVAESGGIWTLHVTTEAAAKFAEQSGDFICWLHDWKEIERPAPAMVDQLAIDPTQPFFGIDPAAFDSWASGVLMTPTGVFEFRPGRSD